MNGEMFDYIYDRAKVQYIKHERAFSACITFMGYDYQEYELDATSARLKLAKKLSSDKYLQKLFKDRK